MLTEILLLVSVGYCVMIGIFGFAVRKARYTSDYSFRPSVSIVVAARNEEKSIRTCLDSMLALTYPHGLLEIVFVDDGSEDHTADIITEYSLLHPHIKLLVASPGTGNLRGKANALTQGIEATQGEILMFTDADCCVPNHWVEETVKYYTDRSVGVVAGFTSLEGGRIFDAIQALDWFVLFSVAAATIRLRYPVTAVGNNLSFRRGAYNEIGGYRNIPFSVTEDYALFHAVTRHAGYQARFPLDSNTLVSSKPCESWYDLYRQKKRWFVGGKGMDAKSMLIFAIPYFFIVGTVFSPAFAPMYAMILPLVLKTIVDFLLALPSILAFRRRKLIRYFPLFEVYYTLYVLVFPLIVLFAKEILWKERTLTNGKKGKEKALSNAKSQ